MAENAESIMNEILQAGREQETIRMNISELRNDIIEGFNRGGIDRIMGNLQGWWDTSVNINNRLMALNPNTTWMLANGDQNEKEATRIYLRFDRESKKKLSAIRAILNNLRILNNEPEFVNASMRARGTNKRSVPIRQKQSKR